MEYPRPAGMGGASWGFPFPLGHVAPAGSHPASWGAPLADMFAPPWTGAGAGKYAAPWTGAGAGQYAAPWVGAGAGKYTAPWAGAGKMVPDGTPPFGGGLYPFPDYVTGDDLMSQPQMVIDLVTLIEPALDSVLPAIQGLLQIPALLMEDVERANLLGRWSDVAVALMPGAEEESPASTEFGPGESAPGSAPQQDP